MWRLKLKQLARACSSSASAGGSKQAASSSSSSSWNMYGRLLEQHPIKAKMLSSGVIMGSGDFACQWLTRRHEAKEKGATSDEEEEEAEADDKAEAVGGYDWHRTAKFALLGGSIIGPTLHHWYSFLFRTFPGVTLQSTVKRLLVDQTVFAPAFIPIFFTGLQLLDGNFDTGDIKSKLEADYADTLVANWQLWIPAMFLNFRYVPAKYQVLYSNFVGFGWNVYLSNQSFKKPEGPERRD